MKHKISWVDGGREPTCPPDPAYPNGKDLDCSDLDLDLDRSDLDLTARGSDRSCIVKLPYPAKRCGYFVVECETCGRLDVVTTAGRSDDPRSLTVPCKIAEGGPA